jgi:hypothetical protein
MFKQGHLPWLKPARLATRIIYSMLSEQQRCSRLLGRAKFFAARSKKEAPWFAPQGLYRSGVHEWNEHAPRPVEFSVAL